MDERRDFLGGEPMPGRSERDREVGHLDYRGTEVYHREPEEPEVYRRSDEKISEDLYDQLRQDPYVDASDVEVEVRDANVTLFGSVPDKWMKYSIEEIAEGLPDVVRVDNHIRVARPGKRS